MTALALAERLDMPRLASDVRTTLAGLERSGLARGAARPPCEAAIDRAAGRGRRQRRAARRCFLLGHPYLGPRPSSPRPTMASAAPSPAAGRAGTPVGALRRRGPLEPRRVAQAAGAAGTTRCGCSTSTREVAPPIYARACSTATAARRSWRRAATRRAPSWPRACARSGRARGWSRSTGGAAELALAEPAGDQAAALATYRRSSTALTRIWHPLFQRPGPAGRDDAGGRSRRARPTAVPRPSGPRDAAVVERLLADGRRSCSSARGDSLGSWGPEGRAWEARLDAELLRLALAGRRRRPRPGRAARRPGASAVAAFEDFGARYELAACGPAAGLAPARRRRRRRRPRARSRPRPRRPARLGAQPLLATRARGQRARAVAADAPTRSPPARPRSWPWSPRGAPTARSAAAVHQHQDR